MRPINLIPADQRRGASRGPGGRASMAGYAALGALGVAVVCMLGVVVTSNKINSSTEELAELQADSQSERQVADALRPYGQFADMQRARMTQIETLAGSRFDWERPLRQLSKAIPRNVWLLSVSGSEPGVEMDGGGGGDAASLKENTTAPSFTLQGCTYSQHAVARMMTRMRNLDDVTEVHLAKSTRKDAADGGGAAAAAAAAPQQGQEAAAGEDSDCIGSARVTKFDLLVVFGGASQQGAAAGAAGVPSGAAAPVANANAAVAQGGAASAAAGGTTP